MTEVSAICAFNGDLRIAATIRNAGGANTGIFDLGFYLSPDMTITTDDTFFAVSTFDVGLIAGETGQASGTVSVDLVDLGLAPGTYFVGAFVDDLFEVVESNEANNALAGEQVTLPCEESFLTLDFGENGGNTQGWTGAALPGFGGGVFVNESGLCMVVPAAGDNIVAWVSPESLVELLPATVYKAEVFAVTDQTNPDAIPPFFFIYDNFFSAGEGNNFGGFFWVLDVAGGAQGIGRPQGRSVFDFYFAPNAINTPQWEDGAFGPAADPFNDIRLQFRVIDANEALLTSADFGTICVSRLELSAIPRDELVVSAVVYDPPITDDTLFAQAADEVGTGGTVTIDDQQGFVFYDLPTTGFVRKTLGPFNTAAGADINLQLFPVVWEENTLYRTQSTILADTSVNDPVDVIFIAMDTASNELGMFQFTTRGAPGGVFDRAASPKLEPATYEAYFFSQNTTESTVPNLNRLRPLAIFINSTEIAGAGTGGDAFIVDSLEVQRMIIP